MIVHTGYIIWASACLYLFFAIPNLIVNTDLLIIKSNYFSLICKAKILYPPQFYLKRKVLIKGPCFLLSVFWRYFCDPLLWIVDCSGLEHNGDTGWQFVSNSSVRHRSPEKNIYSDNELRIIHTLHCDTLLSHGHHPRTTSHQNRTETNFSIVSKQRMTVD